MPALPTRLRGGMDDNMRLGATGGAMCCCIMFIWIVVHVFTVSASPNEYGMILGRWAGKMSGKPVRGGIHFRWSPWNPWYLYPATQVTILWADSGAFPEADDHPVIARSGHDHDHADSGKNEASGQPVNITCALQYKYKQDELPDLYYEIGEHWLVKGRYMTLARFAIIAAAQEFSPNDFWTGREKIAERMKSMINDALGRYHAYVEKFQILRVEFMHTFEDSVIQTQVAEQQITLNSFTQEVTKVKKSIDVLSSENQASMAAISSNAQRIAKVMTANATQEAFALKQQMKANMYSELQTKLGFDNDMMQEYIKIKSLMQKSQNGPVVISIPAPDLSSPIAPEKLEL